MSWRDMLKNLELSLISRDARIKDLESDVRVLKVQLEAARVVHKVEKS